MTELIVGRTFLGIGEHFIGLLGLLELLFGGLVIRIAVRMQLHGEAPVSLLDVGFRRIARQFQTLYNRASPTPVPG